MPQSKRQNSVLIGALVLLLIVLCGIYLWSNRARPAPLIEPTEAEQLVATWVQQNITMDDSVFASPSIQSVSGRPSTITWSGTGSEMQALQNAQIDYIVLPPGLLQTIWDSSTWASLYYEQTAVFQSDAELPGNTIIWKRIDTSKPTLNLAYIPDRFRVLGVDVAQRVFDSAEITPSASIKTTLHLQKIATVHTLENILVTYRLSTADGQPLHEDRINYQGEKSLESLLPNETFSMPLDVQLPEQLAPGAYKLDISFSDDLTTEYHEILENGQIARLDRLLLSYFAISPTATGDQLARPDGDFIPIQFGDNISLSGYEINIDEAQQTIDVHLFWQASAPPTKNYTVFVQIWDEVGNFVANHDSQPDNGSYPTTALGIGEAYIVDRHQISLPSPRAGDTYRVVAGLYLLETGERLPILSASGGTIGDMTELPRFIYP